MSAPPNARHLLVPFAGRGSPACRTALADLRLPKLEALLARLTRVHDDTQDDSTRSPPHERALAEALGIAAADGCIPWAALEAQRAGLGPTRWKRSAPAWARPRTARPGASPRCAIGRWASTT